LKVQVSKQKDFPRPARNILYVTKLPADTKSDELKEHFSKFGTVKDVYLKYYKKDNKFKGKAFVKFEDKKSAIKARQAKGQTLRSNKIKVHFAKPKRVVVVTRRKKVHRRRQNKPFKYIRNKKTPYVPIRFLVKTKI